MISFYEIQYDNLSFKSAAFLLSRVVLVGQSTDQPTVRLTYGRTQPAKRDARRIQKVGQSAKKGAMAHLKSRPTNKC